MLKEDIPKDPQLQARIIELAKRGATDAIELLGHLGDLPNFRSALIEMSSTSHFWKENVHNSLSRLVRFPDVQRQINRIIRNTKDADELSAWAYLFSRSFHNEPAMLPVMEKLLRLPNKPEYWQTKTTIIKTILALNPNHSKALEQVRSVLKSALGKIGKMDSSDGIFALAHSYLNKELGIERIVQDALPKFLASAKKAPSDHGDYEISGFLDLYLDLFLDHSRKKPLSKTEAFLRDMLEIAPFSRGVLTTLVTRYDELPPSLKSLAEQYCERISLPRLYAGRYEIERFSSLAKKIAVRDAWSSDSDLLYSGLMILKNSSFEDPEMMRELEKIANSNGNSDIDIERRERAQSFLSVLPRAGVSARTQKFRSKEEIAEKRGLLFSSAPPRGWREVIQMYSYVAQLDLFSFAADFDGPSLDLAHGGLRFRSQALAEAHRKLEHEGMVFSPSSWLLDKYRRRMARVSQFQAERKLTTAEERKLAQEARGRLLIDFPHLSFGEVVPNPKFKKDGTVGERIPLIPIGQQLAPLVAERYQFYVREAEANLRGSKPQAQKDAPIASVLWRKAAQQGLEDVFRSNLLAILKANHGEIMVRSLEYDSPEDIRLRESDLAHVRLIPESPNSGVDADIFWHGKMMRIKFQGHSTLGEAGPVIGQDASEMATLTLGSAEYGVGQMAEEILLDRTFDNLVERFKTASALIQNDPSFRLEARLTVEAANDKIQREDLVRAPHVLMELVPLLWAPLRNDPNHWRKREEAALDAGRPVLDLRVRRAVSHKDLGLSAGFEADEESHAHNKGKVSGEQEDLFFIEDAAVSSNGEDPVLFQARRGNSLKRNPLTPVDPPLLT